MDEHGGHEHSHDHLLIEIHRILSRVSERLEGHVEWDERVHKESQETLASLEKRLRPVEEFHETAKVFKWPVIGIVTPILAGIGAIVWEKIKTSFGGHQ